MAVGPKHDGLPPPPSPSMAEVGETTAFPFWLFIVMDGLDREIPVQSTPMYHYNPMNTGTFFSYS